jgi:hypothetical protein
MLASLLLLGCPQFPDDGVYACDPAHDAGDCAPAPTCSRGYCRVYSAPAGVTLSGIGGNPTAVAVVGSGGHVAESVDGGWSSETLAGSGDLVGVAYRPTGETVVASAGGALWRRAPGVKTWSSSVVAGGGQYLMVFERSGDVWVGRANARGPLQLVADGGINDVDNGFQGDWSDVGGTGPGEVGLLEIEPAPLPTRAFFSTGPLVGPMTWAHGQVEAVFMRGNTLTPPDELVVAGAGGFLATLSDHPTDPVHLTDAGLHDIFGNSSDDYWVVGGAGTVIHYLQGSWSLVELDPTEELIGGWQRGPNDVWLVSRRSVFHSSSP